MNRADNTLDIHAAIHRYSRAMDTRQWALMDEVFTPDAKVVMNGALFCHDRAQAVALIRAAIECCSITHHMNSNIEVAFEGDSARVRNNFRAWHRGAAPNEALTYEALGWYDDVFVRTPQGWRISRREENSPIDFGDVQAFFALAMPAFAEAAARARV